MILFLTSWDLSLSVLQCHPYFYLMMNEIGSKHILKSCHCAKHNERFDIESRDSTPKFLAESSVAK